jgi:hypothetical protein
MYLYAQHHVSKVYYVLQYFPWPHYYAVQCIYVCVTRTSHLHPPDPSTASQRRLSAHSSSPTSISVHKRLMNDVLGDEGVRFRWGPA